MQKEYIAEAFNAVVSAIRARINEVEDWGPTDQREGQYNIDLVSDELACQMLTDAGMDVLSEESGLSGSGRRFLAVVDPIDGSTNAHAGLPWYATSLCAFDAQGPIVALVANHATGVSWRAERGEGAFRGDDPISPSGVSRISDAIVSVSGLPGHHFGWKQFRCFGAAALDICAVADATWDCFADLSEDAHGVWDYAGAMLVCCEAGAVIKDAKGRDLDVREPSVRRTPVAAATPELHDELMKHLDQNF